MNNKKPLKMSNIRADGKEVCPSLCTFNKLRAALSEPIYAGHCIPPSLEITL